MLRYGQTVTEFFSKHPYPEPDDFLHSGFVRRCPASAVRDGEYMEMRLLRSPDAAKYVGLALQTLAKLRVSGGGPSFVKLGRAVAYDPRDLDSWIAAHKRQSTSETPKVG